MIIDTLRAATKAAHRDLDHFIFPIIKQVDSNDSYTKLLEVFYGFYKPVFDSLDHYLNDTNIQLYSQRRKPVRILDDLHAVGAGTSMLPVSHECPLIDSTAKAFGAFYVLEGSTMGGTIIVKQLSQQLPLLEQNAFSFFSGYGNKNPEMWNIFLNDLDKNNSESETEEIVSTATQTFSTFGNWIKNNYEFADQQYQPTGS